MRFIYAIVFWVLRMSKNDVPPQGLSRRIEELCSNFEYYLKKFDEYKPFTGPSVYLHSKTIERLRELGVSNALKDKLFFEYLYATLASWGMHRMGEKDAFPLLPRLTGHNRISTMMTARRN